MCIRDSPYPSDFFDCSSYTLAHQKRTAACCGHYITTKALRTLIPVSYTHLDVYKRQQKTEAENLEIVQMVRALRMTPAQLSAMLSGGTIPVSYTHLDVYKRQGFAEPKRENVPGLLFGAEHSGQSPSAWQQHLSGRLYCPEV